MLLLTEDDASLRLALSEYISTFVGITPLCAENGKDALEVLSQNKVTTLVTDWTMPVMGGKELVEHTLRQYPDTRIIVFSGSFIESTEKNSGVTYLRKPSDIPILMELLTAT